MLEAMPQVLSRVAGAEISLSWDLDPIPAGGPMHVRDIDLSEPADSLTLDLDGTTIDDVTWDAGWPLTNNVSLMLHTKHYEPDDNGDPMNWCDGVDAYASGRLGSPGLESSCP